MFNVKLLYVYKREPINKTDEAVVFALAWKFNNINGKELKCRNGSLELKMVKSLELSHASQHPSVSSLSAVETTVSSQCFNFLSCRTYVCRTYVCRYY